MICLPKLNSRLGIPNLKERNIALLMRWLWKFSANDNFLWTQTVSHFYGTSMPLTSKSFFLEDIQGLRPLLQASTIAQDDGSLLWKWELNNQYSSKSTYSLLIDPGVNSSFATILWKAKIPQRIQIFLWGQEQAPYSW